MLLTLDMSYFVTVRNNFSCFFSALSISIEIRVYVYAFGFVSRDKHRVRISTTCQLVFMVLFSCVFFFVSEWEKARCMLRVLLWRLTEIRLMIYVYLFWIIHLIAVQIFLMDLLWLLSYISLVFR